MKRASQTLILAAIAALVASENALANEQRLVRNLRLGERVVGFLRGIALEQHGKTLGPVCGQLVERAEGAFRLRVGRGPCPERELLVGNAVVLEVDAEPVDLGGSRCTRLGCFTLRSADLTTATLEIGSIEDSADAQATEFGPVSELSSLCTTTTHAANCRLLVNADGRFGGIVYRPYRLVAPMTLADDVLAALRRDGIDTNDLPCVQQVRRTNGEERLVIGYLSARATLSERAQCTLGKPLHTSQVVVDAGIQGGNVILEGRIAGRFVGVAGGNKVLQSLCSGDTASACYFARERGRIVGMNASR